MNSECPQTNPEHPQSSHLSRSEFAALFSKSYQKLWLIAVGITGDRFQAEDIIQDSAIVAFEKIESFTVGTNFSAWISEIVRYKSLNHIRRASNRMNESVDPITIDQYTSSADDQRSTILIQMDASDILISGTENQFDDELLAALNGLGHIARACLLLRIVQQLKYDEISELLDMPAGTAMSHVHRSKQILRQRLQNYFSNTPPHLDSKQSENSDKGVQS